MLLTWLADTLRQAGCEVVELDGWERRESRTGFDPVGVVWHHTATPRSASDGSVDRLLRDGRSDLPGPLAQLGLRRDGTFVVVAAGRCNHNGYGTWGNDSIGIEAYNDGRGEPWPAVQLDAYARGTAAICRRMGWNIAQVRGHKETDPGRKPDPLFNMDEARATVASYLEDDDMTPAECEAVVRKVLNEGTAFGYGNWADTSEGVVALLRDEVKRLQAVQAEVAALRSAVAQLGAGGNVDYAKVQAAAEAAVKATLGGLDDG